MCVGSYLSFGEEMQCYIMKNLKFKTVIECFFVCHSEDRASGARANS